jgi:hypothetical protein
VESYHPDDEYEEEMSEDEENELTYHREVNDYGTYTGDLEYDMMFSYGNFA